MAYLPGERPLIHPWEESSVTSLTCDDVSSQPILNVRTGLCGKDSAYVEWGNGSSVTKIVAIVKGPRQQTSQKAIFEVDVSFTAFAEYRSGVYSGKEIASYVKEAVEGCIDMDEYPQCAVTVFLKVIQSGQNLHSMISASVLAAMTACKSSGIKVRDEVICLPVAVLPSGDLRLNPSDIEATECPCVSIGLTVKGRQLCFMHLSGKLSKSVDELDALVTLVDASVEEFRSLVADRTM